MKNEEIIQIAMQQSAVDENCRPEDFIKEENVLVYSEESEGARRYLKLPFCCNLVSYGDNVVASVNEECAGLVKSYIAKYSAAGCFETPALHVLNDGLQEKGMRICFMAEYFLPDMGRLQELPCGYRTVLLEQAELTGLYTGEWDNALCRDRKELDKLAAAAYDGDKLIGLSGCSADCETMWQIGVDVLPQYRRKGIASSLTAMLAMEIFRRGKVPFYCAAWSNLRSVRNAIKSGFQPAWVELTAKPADYVDKMNL